MVPAMATMIASVIATMIVAHPLLNRQVVELMLEIVVLAMLVAIVTIMAAARHCMVNVISAMAMTLYVFVVVRRQAPVFMHVVHISMVIAAYIHPVVVAFWQDLV